jgi:hypothetical protein
MRVTATTASMTVTSSWNMSRACACANRTWGRQGAHSPPDVRKTPHGQWLSSSRAFYWVTTVYRRWKRRPWPLDIPCSRAGGWSFGRHSVGLAAVVATHGHVCICRHGCVEFDRIAAGALVKCSARYRLWTAHLVVSDENIFAGRCEPGLKRLGHGDVRLHFLQGKLRLRLHCGRKTSPSVTTTVPAGHHVLQASIMTTSGHVLALQNEFRQGPAGAMFPM